MMGITGKQGTCPLAGRRESDLFHDLIPVSNARLHTSCLQAVFSMEASPQTRGFRDAFLRLGLSERSEDPPS